MALPQGKADYIYSNYFYEIDSRYNKNTIFQIIFICLNLYILDGIKVYSIYKKPLKMKLFIYKSLIICFLFFLVFHLTFGYIIRSYKNEIFNTFSEDKVDYVKEVLRSEIKEYNEKENIFYPETQNY